MERGFQNHKSGGIPLEKSVKAQSSLRTKYRHEGRSIILPWDCQSYSNGRKMDESVEMLLKRGRSLVPGRPTVFRNLDRVGKVFILKMDSELIGYRIERSK